jgi:tetratricopeptide (TPR) repeat protein
VYSYRCLLIVFAGSAWAASPEEALALNRRGLEAESRFDYAEAGRNYLQSVEMFRALGPGFEAHLSVELFNLAESMCWQGRWRESAAVFDESAALSRRAIGPKHIQTARALSAFGNVSMMMGDMARAEALMTEALAIERENYPADLQLSHTLAGLSSLKMRSGKLSEALPLADEALSVALKAEGTEGPESATMYQNVAQVHQTAHRPERALPLYRKARAILERLGMTDDPRYASLLSQEGLALMNEGKIGLAESELKRAVELLNRSPALPFELAIAQHNLGLLMIKRKKYAEADALLTKALSAEQDTTAQSKETREALAQVRAALR